MNAYRIYAPEQQLLYCQSLSSDPVNQVYLGWCVCNYYTYFCCLCCFGLHNIEELKNWHVVICVDNREPHIPKHIIFWFYLN